MREERRERKREYDRAQKQGANLTRGKMK